MYTIFIYILYYIITIKIFICCLRSIFKVISPPLSCIPVHNFTSMGRSFAPLRASLRGRLRAHHTTLPMDLVPTLTCTPLGGRLASIHTTGTLFRSGPIVPHRSADVKGTFRSYVLLSGPPVEPHFPSERDVFGQVVRTGTPTLPGAREADRSPRRTKKKDSY